MTNSPDSASISGDPLVRFSYWIALLLLIVVMLLRGHLEGPDDVMRWVAVQDLIAGQGWFDLYQHRLGPENGTLMHWSRIVDAPIAAIYWLGQLALSPEAAMGFVAFVWPSTLAGFTLWAFGATGGSLGGRSGALFALVVGAVAIANSGKFDYFSFDHHGLQILLFSIALMFFVQRKTRPRSGFWLGACLALSISIGTESIIQIAAIALFVAIDWITCGSDSRSRMMQFCWAIVLTLTAAIIATTSRESFLFPGCDALTLSIGLPVALAALGMLVAAAVASNRPVWFRATAFLTVGAGSLICASMFAPHCLSNPVGQIPFEMREYWLSQVTEAQGVRVVFQRHTGEVTMLIFMAVVTIFAAGAFVRNPGTRLEYSLFLSLMIVGLILFLYQSRMMTFLAMSLVAVQAQVLRFLYLKYKVEGQRWFGVAMILYGVAISPKVGSGIERQIALVSGSSNAAVASVGKPGGTIYVTSCDTPEAYRTLSDLAPGMVLVDFDFASNVLRYTDHSVLGGNYHRNQAGILAQIALFRANASEIGGQLGETGIRYVLLCKSNARAQYWSSVSNGQSLQMHLSEGRVPDYLEEVQGQKDAAFRVFTVKNQ